MNYPPPAPDLRFQWGPPARVESRGISIAALVCGIIGVVCGLVPIMFLVCWALGVVAMVLGCIAWSKQLKVDQPSTMAKWGIALGLISFFLGCFGFIIVSNAFNDVDRGFDCLDQAETLEEMDECNED